MPRRDGRGVGAGHQHPAGRAGGQRPSRSAGSARSSSTTSQERLVSPSQLRNWAATDSQLLAWSRPVTAAVAAA